VALTMSPGTMKLTICSNGVVRVMYSPTSTLPAGQDFVVTNHSWPAASFQAGDSSGNVTVATRKLKIAVDKATGAVAFYDASGKWLLAETTAASRRECSWRIARRAGRTWAASPAAPGLFTTA
jgi:hypothetical protein